MASASEHTEPQTFVVIDFESSGRAIHANGSGDRIFGFGIAIGTYDLETGAPKIEQSASVGIRPCATPPTTAAGWRELWRERGWDTGCQQFWLGADDDAKPSENMQQLNGLFVPTHVHRVVDTYAEAAAILDTMLHKAGKFTLIVDCICFDPWLANLLLVEHGYEPITHDRAGNYRRGGTYDEDSILMLRNDPSQLLKRSRELAVDCVAQHFAGSSVGPHNPRWDAVKILCRVLLAMTALRVM